MEDGRWKAFQAGWNSQCKGPEAGPCLASWKNSEQAQSYFSSSHCCLATLHFGPPRLLPSTPHSLSSPYWPQEGTCELLNPALPSAHSPPGLHLPQGKSPLHGPPKPCTPCPVPSPPSSLLSLPLTLLQSHMPPHCSNTPHLVLPQGLCTDCALCPDHSPPTYPLGSLPHLH